MINGENYFQRVGNGHDTAGMSVQIFPYAEFKQGHINHIIAFRHANLICKITDRFRSVPSSPQSANGWHTGLLPSTDMSVFNQLQELPLAHYCIAQVQPGKFNLSGTVITFL